MDIKRTLRQARNRLDYATGAEWTKFHPGCRVELIEASKELARRVPVGTQGTVKWQWENRTIEVAFDNGQTSTVNLAQGNAMTIIGEIPFDELRKLLNISD